MKGIDISNNDGIINFQSVKDSGVEIVYIKVTEGLTYNDPMMKQYYDGFKNVGLKIGFYHFMRHNNPTQEAIHFLNAISSFDYGCVPMLDVEHESLKDGTAVDRVREFADYCKSQGVAIGLYTYTSFLKDSMDNNSLDLLLWIAEYEVSSPNIDKSYVGFQYSETGQVLEINTGCDLDEFNEGIFINGGIKKVESIVIYNYGTDMHSAEVLADYLNCPTISNARAFDFSCVKNVYAVGGTKEQYTSYLTQLISGSDRYSTNQEVLDFIKNGGK